MIQKLSLFLVEITESDWPAQNAYKNLFCLIPYAHSQIIGHTAYIAVVYQKRLFKWTESTYFRCVGASISIGALPTGNFDGENWIGNLFLQVVFQKSVNIFLIIVL